MTLTVTFDPANPASPGALEPLRVSDTSRLVGWRPQISVSQVQTGSHDNFYLVPTSLTRMAVQHPLSVHLSINGVPGACALGAECAFRHADTTPAIDSVSPTSLDFSSGQPTTLGLTISGAFPLNTSASATRVSVGPMHCAVTVVSETEINCTLTNDPTMSVATRIQAGRYKVQVYFDPLGYAATSSNGAADVTVRALRVDSLSPKALAATGWTLVTVSGEGIDATNCMTANVLSIGGVPCALLSCASDGSSLTALYPGSGGAANPDAVVALSVTDPSDPSAEIDLAVWGGTAVVEALSDRSATPVILRLDEAPADGTGGRLSAFLGGHLIAEDVESAFLVPLSRIRTPTPGGADGEYTTTYKTGGSTLSDALAARIECANRTGGWSSSVMCDSGALPSGHYYFGITYSTSAMASDGAAPGLLVYPGRVVVTAVEVTRVWPSAGSIGGGTELTLTGTGFSTVPGSNLVVVTVPVSTTHPNGVVLCDVVAESASATQLTCITRPHLAADASAEDPHATRVTPTATPTAAVTVAVCAPGLSIDVEKIACWAEPRTARATCGDPATCGYAYDAVFTPVMVNLSPQRGHAGSVLTVSGRFLADVAHVLLTPLTPSSPPPPSPPPPPAYPPTYPPPPGMYNGSSSGSSSGSDTPTAYECASVAAAADGRSVTCVLPALPPGPYRVSLRTEGGEASISEGFDLLGVFPYVTSVSGNAGSLAGGGLLTVGSNSSTDGAAAGFDVAHPEANTVSVGGVLPCALVPGSVTATSLQCRTAPAAGKVFTQYWNWPPVRAFPVQSTLDAVTPDAVTLEAGVNMWWGADPPAPGVARDWFVSRFTFYLPIDAPGNTTFFLSGRDTLQLLVDGVEVGRYAAAAGGASTFSTPLAEGLAKITVIHSDFDSSSASVTLRWDAGSGGSARDLPWASVLPFPPGAGLPLAVSVGGVFAVHDCPAQSIDLTAAGGTGTPLPGELSALLLPPGPCAYVYSSYRTPTLVTPVTTSQLRDTASTTITGQLLGGSDPGSYSASVGGVDTDVLSVVDDPDGFGTQTLTLGLPPLPAGKWDVLLETIGFGYARSPPALRDPPLTLTYGLQTIISPLPGGRGSYWGGVDVSIRGAGFVPTTPGDAPTAEAVGCGKRMSITHVSGGPRGIRLSALIVESNTTNMVVRIERWFDASFSPAVSAVAFRVLVWDDDGSAYGGAMQAIFVFPMGYTPTVVEASPRSMPANAGSNLSITWSVMNKAAITAVGAPSPTTIDLVYGGYSFRCADPWVTATATNFTGYSETVTCTLPQDLPAAPYDISISSPSYGAGWSVGAVNVTQVISGISPERGSAAGGALITLTGSGFNTRTSDNAVALGGSACRVVSASATQLVCRAGPAPGGGTLANESATVSASALPGAPLEDYPGVVFVYDASLSDSVTGVNTTRGSTMGGTHLRIEGSFVGPEADYSVLLGPDGATCAVTAFTPTAIACVTSPPPVSHPAEPYRVNVDRAGVGYAAGEFTYHYVDLWSARTTWGGGPPPIQGDSVYIPTGVTILLDISPPPLILIVIDGVLTFDTNSGADLWLRASYILVRTGNFSAGSPESPLLGRARITLTGVPSDVHLPQYGSKVLAVRDGWATLHGAHKVPTFTRLAATASPGDTSLVLDGQVNWVVGDLIAVASSSFDGSETDEAVVTSVTIGTSSSTLTLDRPLNFTHLGVRVTGIPGDDRGHVLDMRAEVAVLSRNVKLEGDSSSEQLKYGGIVMVATRHTHDEGAGMGGMPLAPSGIQFEQVEFQQMGQAFRLGKYALHWHMKGNVTGQYINGCAIHRSHNRAVTVHGTHGVLLRDNVAYDTAGHAFFLEDGIETGNTFDGNLGFRTRPSFALLNTDSSPATFWITNPNNTWTNNVAGGSEAGYGFWFRLQDHPDGPSYTPDVCPKYTFSNNVAHSNALYGLRLHPEYLPKADPCGRGYEQFPAVFTGLTAYKNGMRGAVATQVGLVVFDNFTLADNGAGSRSHKTIGQETVGAAFEMTWVVDDRPRTGIEATMMAGLRNALLVARSDEGSVGSAGAWPQGGRRIVGVVGHSSPKGESKHTALSSLLDVTFVGYSGGQFMALEACGKCEFSQGGATTQVGGVRWLPAGSPVALSN
ncbi:hypothetical protein FOA52_004208 [Chlamydomonas sp. UWO 241]|nr:hypothetical protein FOA52_004208 [Chlamydomonas sp. UWO 241]